MKTFDAIWCDDLSMADHDIRVAKGRKWYYVLDGESYYEAVIPRSTELDSAFKAQDPAPFGRASIDPEWVRHRGGGARFRPNW